MQTFFTSDTHFDDHYAIQYFNRPFKNVGDMNRFMVQRWNEVVTENDTVYHLGDFTLDDIEHLTKWVSQLNGNIKILPGSHDDAWLRDFVPNEKVQVIAPLVSVEVPKLMTGNSSQVIVLCHYSLQVWDRSNQGSWHLFGHSHGKLRGIGLSFDVGVDCTDFVPLSLGQVAAKMTQLTSHKLPLLPSCLQVNPKSLPSAKETAPAMNKRINISSGAKWEDIVGYSRAVRIGNMIEVAGTTAVDENGQVVGLGDAGEQTKFILSKIEKALIATGATLKDVVRTRMFVTNIADWEMIGRAHGLYFKDIKPVATMVEVKSLISPELLVEIEATAILVE